jgi:hypothetical protein
LPCGLCRPSTSFRKRGCQPRGQQVQPKGLQGRRQRRPIRHASVGATGRTGPTPATAAAAGEPPPRGMLLCPLTHADAANIRRPGRLCLPALRVQQTRLPPPPGPPPAVATRLAETAVCRRRSSPAQGLRIPSANLASISRAVAKLELHLNRVYEMPPVSPTPHGHARPAYWHANGLLNGPSARRAGIAAWACAARRAPQAECAPAVKSGGRAGGAGEAWPSAKRVRTIGVGCWLGACMLYAATRWFLVRQASLTGCVCLQLLSSPSPALVQNLLACWPDVFLPGVRLACKGDVQSMLSC